MEQRKPSIRRRKFDRYEKIVATYRDSLSDDEMGVFLALHENMPIEEIAADMSLLVDEVQAIIERYIPPKHERRSKLGEPYKRRLSRQAFAAILAEHEDLSPREIELIESMMASPNQVVAALKLDLTYGEFMKEYMAMRNKHGF